MSIIVNSDIFRHIHVLSDIFSYMVAYLEPCVTLAYSEPCHIQNPGIFSSQDIFRTLSRHFLAYSECCVTLTYWESCHIQNFAIFKILAYLGPKAYSESCLFRHHLTYSGIFNNDSLDNINFLFFHFNLTYFLTKFKKIYIFLTTMTSISMLDQLYLNNTWFLKIALYGINKAYTFVRKQILW